MLRTRHDVTIEVSVLHRLIFYQKNDTKNVNFTGYHFGPISADISAEIRDENIWYIATWRIWGACWETSTKNKYPLLVYDPKLILSSVIWFMEAITCIFIIRYDVWFDVLYLVQYRDISSDTRYLVYNFADRYIADIRYLKHWSCPFRCCRTRAT